jgi:hypothetical protein
MGIPQPGLRCRKGRIRAKEDAQMSPPLPPDPRRTFRPPEIIFELLYDAEAGVIGAADVAARHIADPAAAAELAHLAQTIADVRKRYDDAPPSNDAPSPDPMPEVRHDQHHR